jgi:hypothetical protein
MMQMTTMLTTVTTTMTHVAAVEVLEVVVVVVLVVVLPHIDSKLTIVKIVLLENVGCEDARRANKMKTPNCSK